MAKTQLSSCDHVGCEYADSDASCTHDYLLPFVLQQLHEVSQGKAIRVLDLGCGNGYAAARIAEQGHLVTGVDISSDGIEIARASFPGISYDLCSVYDDDLIDKIGGQVDCIVSLEVVEHLFFPRKLFQQSLRLLKSDGHLIVQLRIMAI